MKIVNQCYFKVEGLKCHKQFTLCHLNGCYEHFAISHVVSLSLLKSQQ